MSRSKKYFSSQFERDYAFYLDNKDKFTFAGSNIKKDYSIQFPGEPEPIDKDDDGNDITVPFFTPYAENGKSAKACFHLLDSQGKRKPCAEPQLLVEILTCKAAINLQIKTWAQSRAEYSLSLFELKEYLEHYKAPEWVLTAIENQKMKILKEWIAEKKYQANYYKVAFELHLGEFLQEERVDSHGSGVILDPNKSNT